MIVCPDRLVKLVTLLSIHSALAQTTLPAWPLAVKAPFFNSWYVGGEVSVPLSSSSPINWSFEDMGWYCAIIVDGAAFRLMGADEEPPIEPAKQLTVELTPTRTIFAMQAGPVLVNLTFFTPVTPTDLVRQSIPFSYLYASVKSSDSSMHSVSIYSDVLSDWVTGNASLSVVSNGVVENDIVILSSQLSVPQAFTTVGGTMYDGTIYYATSATNSSKVTYQIGSDVRASAMNSSGLSNTVQSSSPSSSTNELGLFVDLGDVSTEGLTTAWAIGFYRDPVVQFETLDGKSQPRSSYFLSNFSDPQDVVSFFLDDFETAIQTADAFDANVIFETESISETYKDLVVPIIRQVMTTLDITISKNSDGSWNTTDVSAFMYDLGLIGFNGPNPLDMLYAAFPALLYLNPSIGGFLLKPSLELHNTSLYTLPYAGTNLGLGYPNVTLKNTAHNFGIETSSSMLIMVLAHFQASGDPSLILQYYDLLSNWATYLVESAMNLGNQTTSPGDFVPLTNQTNLSLKGIIGIAAMAKISDRFGNANDSSTFQRNANSLMQQWMTSSISNSGERILSVFGQQDSGGVIYNMYADKWLGLNLIPDTIYGIQTSFYASQFALRTNAFGMPLDLSVADVSRADWIVFAAAATTDNTTRDTMLAAVHRYISSGINDSPLGPLYDPTTGGTPIARAASSPAMGAMFSLLTLTNTSFNGSSITAPSPSPTTKTGSTKTKQTHTKLITIAIAGAAGGAVIAGCVLYVLCRIRQKRKEMVLPSDSSNANQPESTPAQSDNRRRSTVDPHPHILFLKLPEVPIVRPEKRRNDAAFIQVDVSGPTAFASSSLTSSSQTSELSADLIPSLPEALRPPDEQNSNEIISTQQAFGTTFDASRVLVIGGEGGEGTVVFSEAPPSYEE